MKLLFLNCLFQAGETHVCHVVRGHEWHDLGAMQDPKLLAIQMGIPLIELRRGRMRVDIETIFTVPRRIEQTFVFDQSIPSISTWRTEPVDS